LPSAPLTKAKLVHYIVLVKVTCVNRSLQAHIDNFESHLC